MKQICNILSLIARYADVQAEHNSCGGLLVRSAGYHLETNVTLDANNGSDVKSLFAFTKSVRVLALHLEVIDATTLNNCTGVYFDAWDGASSEIITADGAVLSNFEVDSFALKDQDNSIVLTTARADQVRMTEPAAGKKSHQPFILTTKSGQTNHIRLHYTTTDTPINAQLKVVCEFSVINSGDMELA
jgi:hypothetical protein